MNKVYVVGIGPGKKEYLSGQAAEALSRSDVICGYTVYVELVREMYPGKEYVTTAMGAELERCRRGLELAAQGNTVSMVCSGDAGVYGMAGPMLKMAGEFPTVDIEVVPGITAALSGAAVLGAPLMQDFCVISLSDLLTPKSLIETRLRAAAAGDFPICLYNPSSRQRKDYLRWACEILLETRSPETVCGWVRNIGREGQTHELLTLEALSGTQVDMFTTVFIGNSATRLVSGRMVTPRGYENKA